MLYHWYEFGHAALKPARAVTEGFRHILANPFNPLTHTVAGKHALAACEVFERTTRRYSQPIFGLSTTTVDGIEVPVNEYVVWQRPFCRLVHFRREFGSSRRANDPKVLLVAPMSGHFSTLLRGTVEALLPNHDVYITDWQDARCVDRSEGSFDLDDYIDYVREILALLRGQAHVFAVCQPAVPVLAAVSLMEEDNDPGVPLSVILAGGPVDTRISPTAVNDVAAQRGIEWFRHNVLTSVPWPHAGHGRLVYPGFLQLSGFMAMNIDRHANAHQQLFFNLIRGDGDSAAKHCQFYDEYLAVMDLTASFYMDTIEKVFIRHLLPKGKLTHRGRPVRPEAVRRAALMTIEGEKDDITGLGQCRAAHTLCMNVGTDKRAHIEIEGVGHYGIFNGSRFRREIAPKLSAFMRRHTTASRNVPMRTHGLFTRAIN